MRTTYERNAMFNRALQVRVVKAKPVTPVEELKDRDAFQAKVGIISAEVRKAARNITLAGAGYIVLDTIRQVTIELAKK